MEGDILHQRLDCLDHQSSSSLSITSTCDSVPLSPPPPPSTFLPPKTRLSNSSRSKSIVHTPPMTSKQTSLPLKKPFTSFRAHSSSETRFPSTTHSPPPSKLLNQRTVPPVPPRKSSIPRPIIKPPPPQRNSSNNLFLRKTHLNL